MILCKKKRDDFMQEDAVKQKILEVYDQSVGHDGYSNFSVSIKILKRNQKEVIVDAGLQYRFIVGEDLKRKESFGEDRRRKES